MNLFADTVAAVRRKKADELFLVRMVAKPSPKNKEAADTGGAYVNCWIDADDLRSAEQTAIEKIRAEQWQATKFEHWEIVCRQCYIDDPEIDNEERRESLEQVDEAFQYGFALTFHCWPLEAPDSSDEII